MMNRITAWAGLGAMLSGLAIAGCGGETTPTPPQSTTSSQPSQQADPPQSTDNAAEEEAAPAPSPDRSPAPAPSPLPPDTPPADVSEPAAPADEEPSTAPATDPPSSAAASAGSNADSKVATFAGLIAPKPATWVWHPPSSQFAIAEYVVPGQNGSSQARITVSQAGGSIDANIARWKSQFRSATHEPVEPTIESFEVDGMPVTIVEFAGEYRGMTSVFTPDQLFITAIVQAPSGQTFIRFVGPILTVEPNREAFMQMIRGLRRLEPEK